MLPKERTRPQRILSQHLRLFHFRIEGVSEATPVGAGIVVRRPLGPEKLGRKGLATAPAPRQDYSIDMSALVDISALGKRNAASGHTASTASLKYRSGTMARVNMPDPSTESGPANTILYSH